MPQERRDQEDQRAGGDDTDPRLEREDRAEGGLSEQEEADEAAEDTFPASDPPAW